MFKFEDLLIISRSTISIMDGCFETLAIDPYRVKTRNYL